MHEAGLMRDLMRRIEVAAENERATRVTKIEIWLGALSHMSEAHFREHFAQASAGTLAADAELSVTVSEALDHANAQDVMLQSLEVEG